MFYWQRQYKTAKSGIVLAALHLYYNLNQKEIQKKILDLINGDCFKATFQICETFFSSNMD